MKLNFREEFSDYSPVSSMESGIPVNWSDVVTPEAIAAELAEFYREALDNAAMVEVTDVNGKILSVNDKFCDISGYAREELVGANHRILNSGEHDREFFRQMRRTIARGRIWQGEICNRARNGELYWLATTIVPHRRLVGGVQHFIAIRFDITAQKLAEDRLRRLANIDALTELPNRHNFVRALGEIIDGSDRAHRRTAVGIIDIDHFKDINDCLGHGEGDKLLRELAIRWRGALGRHDEIARLGGDEFGLILRDVASEEDLRRKVDGIFAAIADPLPVGATERLLTASIGLVMVPAGTGGRVELLKNADIALHEAKANGRGRAEVFGEDMQEEVQRRAALRNAFERGLHIGEFVVHYQPIVTPDGESPAAMEALLRWNHPQHGLIRPPQFIEALSDEHLAAQVGGYVMSEVIAQIGAWRRAGVPFASISVNATLGDFRSGRYVDAVLAAISRGLIVPSDICVEITEDVLVGRGGSCARTEIERLHKAGVTIAFDDFGTGFASLRHLRDLPVQMVKIDKSFIRSIVEDKADRAIVKNVIELAHCLGKTVTAEGVETLEQADILKGLGCDRIQGFLIAPAIPPVEIEPLLRANGSCDTSAVACNRAIVDARNRAFRVID